jgi:hypothetical protein
MICGQSVSAGLKGSQFHRLGGSQASPVLVLAHTRAGAAVCTDSRLWSSFFPACSNQAIIVIPRR